MFLACWRMFDHFFIRWNTRHPNLRLCFTGVLSTPAFTLLPHELPTVLCASSIAAATPGSGSNAEKFYRTLRLMDEGMSPKIYTLSLNRSICQRTSTPNAPTLFSISKVILISPSKLWFSCNSLNQCSFSPKLVTSEPYCVHNVEASICFDKTVHDLMEITLHYLCFVWSTISLMTDICLRTHYRRVLCNMISTVSRESSCTGQGRWWPATAVNRGAWTWNGAAGKMRTSVEESADHYWQSMATILSIFQRL